VTDCWYWFWCNSSPNLQTVLSHFILPEQTVLHLKANTHKSPHTCFTLLMNVWPLRMIHNTAYEVFTVYFTVQTVDLCASLRAHACICASVCVHVCACAMFSFSSSKKKKRLTQKLLTINTHSGSQWSTVDYGCNSLWGHLEWCASYCWRWTAHNAREIHSQRERIVMQRGVCIHFCSHNLIPVNVWMCAGIFYS
jgi:hypothetical protein